ncbi:MAG TPA: BPSS1780 family membrane protein [Paucimonas sp.]|nr:BPSS1780 family membrane protein [Paucimonas sp.]
MAALENIPPKSGWLWLKEGFTLFRKQPMELTTLFLGYTFLMLGFGFIPLLGQVLRLILMPVFSMAFLQACVEVEQGRRVYPSLLLAGFRSPAFKPLAALGLFYLAAGILAAAASTLVDGGVFWSIVSDQGTVGADAAREPKVTAAMLFAGLAFMPAVVLLWYAPALIMWNGMSVGKSIFYSVFAVRKAGKAFIVYGLACAMIGILLPAFLSSFIILLTGQSALGMMVLIPLEFILSAAIYCSFYPSYTYIFGKKISNDSAPSP